MRSNVARALDEDLEGVEDEYEADGISIDSGGSLDLLTVPTPSAVVTGKPASTSPSWLQRLRMRLTWGSVTKEEKRALRADAPAAHRPQRVQRQSTINIPTDLLLSALRSTLSSAEDEASDEDIAELSALLRLQLRHELQESSLWLVDAFDILACESGAPSPHSPRAFTHRSEAADMEALSDRFIDGLCGLMQRANYRLFSQREWQFAQSENFMFTLPVDVAWEDLDSGMISRLFVRHPHLGLQAAQLARRVLVFHRGAGVATTTSFFFEEKLDMLLDMTFTAAFRSLYGSLLGMLCPAAAQRRAEEMAAERAERRAAAPTLVDDQTQRINLDRLLPSLSALVCKFFRRLTLQEPTLQEVVVVYAELRADAPAVRLKSFREIPVADVEVVLPGLKVERMKSADVVKLVVILVAGIATAAYSFISSQYAGDTKSSMRGTIVYLTFFGLLIFRAIQTWCSVVNSKYTMNEFIQTTLYHRSQDSQRGVLLSVVNSIAQHELRETLTLYLLMRAHGRQLGAASHGVNSTPKAVASTARTPLDEPYEAEESYLSSPLPGVLGSRRLRAAASSHQASAARALANGCVTSHEAEQLCLHFFRSEFSAAIVMKADEALARLTRLQLARAADEPTADGSTPRGPLGGAPAVAPVYQSYAAVPVSEALARLRLRWGDGARVSAAPAAMATGRHAPALMMLTAPSQHSILERRVSDENMGEPSPTADAPGRDGAARRAARHAVSHLE